MIKEIEWTLCEQVNKTMTVNDINLYKITFLIATHIYMNKTLFHKAFENIIEKRAD